MGWDSLCLGRSRYSPRWSRAIFCLTSGFVLPRYTVVNPAHRPRIRCRIPAADRRTPPNEIVDTGKFHLQICRRSRPSTDIHTNHAAQHRLMGGSPLTAAASVSPTSATTTGTTGSRPPSTTWSCARDFPSRNRHAAFIRRPRAQRDAKTPRSQCRSIFFGDAGLWAAPLHTVAA